MREDMCMVEAGLGYITDSALGMAEERARAFKDAQQIDRRQVQTESGA